MDYDVQFGMHTTWSEDLSYPHVGRGPTCRQLGQVLVGLMQVLPADCMRIIQQQGQSSDDILL
jgi:hypothetical protein